MRIWSETNRLGTTTTLPNIWKFRSLNGRYNLIWVKIVIYDLYKYTSKILIWVLRIF